MLVPFGPQTRIGVVWDAPVGEGGKPVADKKLKAITAPLADVPPLPAISLRFAEWVARYTLAPLGMVVRMMMGSSAVFEPVKPRFGVKRNEDAPEPPRMTPARKRALEIAADGLVRAKGALAAEARARPASSTAWSTAGSAGRGGDPRAAAARPQPGPCATRVRRRAGPRRRTPCAPPPMREAFSVTLLDGVTGSGKTEVYFEAVARTLEKGRQALIMLPEIALTSQFMDRFTRPLRLPAGRVAFGALLGRARPRLARRGHRARRASWSAPARRCSCPSRTSASSSSTRSTTSGFKQEDRVHYQGRDMAVVRGSLGKFAVVLASATPSIESHVNARTGRYAHVELPGRYSGAELPQVAAIDLRQHPPERGKWLSPVLVEAVTETLGRKQQALLFLNRRGYAPLTLCRSCGHRIDCPQCTAWLVEHRYRHRLECHHCGFSLPIPEKCPKCGEPDALVACGPGVERIAEEVAERFPDARAGHAVLRPGARRWSRCARSSRRSRRARPTSSSARRWWPRATTSRSSPTSASSTATWGSARPTRAPPSAPSSSCTR